ncbi:MAG: hypothetical protein U5R14_06675 [Gemmatimonadota bacterium]|nr:hypothetical protein [Gemmatimonadota bacterium]
MPPSRYVSADRLLRMLAYIAVAVVVLVAADAVFRVFGSPQAVRRTFAVIWIVALPLGGWWLWRRTARDSGH